MPPINPELLSDARTIAAYAIFIGSYCVFALGKFPWMKIDRPGADKNIPGRTRRQTQNQHEVMEHIPWATRSPS